MSLKHGLLGLLSYESMTGYDLDKRFKLSLSFFWQATTSQVYRELNGMEKRGWLTSQWVVQSDKPNKRIYTITEAGQAELKEWMRLSDADIQSAMFVKNAFMMRVFFAGNMSVEGSIKMLKRFRKACEQSLEHMSIAHEAIEAYGDLVDHDQRMDFWKITALYGDEYYRAGLIWADKAIAILEKNKP